MDAIEFAKRTALALEEGLEVAKNKEDVVNETRRQYEQATEQLTDVFFSLSSLVHLEFIYQFPLPWFEALWTKEVKSFQKRENSKGIDSAALVAQVEQKKKDDKAKAKGDKGKGEHARRERRKSVVRAIGNQFAMSSIKQKGHVTREFLKELYQLACGPLFERHKLIFSLLLCSSAVRVLGLVTENDWSKLTFKFNICECETFHDLSLLRLSELRRRWGCGVN